MSVWNWLTKRLWFWSHRSRTSPPTPASLDVHVQFGFRPGASTELVFDCCRQLDLLTESFQIQPQDPAQQQWRAVQEAKITAGSKDESKSK